MEKFTLSCKQHGRTVFFFFSYFSRCMADDRTDCHIAHSEPQPFGRWTFFFHWGQVISMPSTSRNVFSHESIVKPSKFDHIFYSFVCLLANTLRANFRNGIPIYAYGFRVMLGNTDFQAPIWW